MKKIPTIFKRNPKKMSEVLPEINPLCQWVFDGEGAPTYKYDGTCCMVKGGEFYKRREVKAGKPCPEGFVEVDYDEITGKRVGWLLVDDSDKWHIEAISNSGALDDGTYELIGPKIQGNPESKSSHVFVSHSDALELPDMDRNFESIKLYLENFSGEGMVFHHNDGRMAKIKRKDFSY